MANGIWPPILAAGAGGSGDRVDRRRFLLTSLGGALAAPLVAEAQQAGRVWRIGVLFGGTPTAGMAGPQPRSPILRSFLEGLRELGYVEGQNVMIERRSAEGKTESLPDLFRELVRLDVKVILASGEQTTPALLRLTRSVAIVQPTLMDPVERGYVKSLARPGGNLTGLSLRVDPAISGKLLELLKEITQVSPAWPCFTKPRPLVSILRRASLRQ
jgi:putative ABC transport system substrate-binding protein